MQTVCPQLLCLDQLKTKTRASNGNLKQVGDQDVEAFLQGMATGDKTQLYRVTVNTEHHQSYREAEVTQPRPAQTDRVEAAVFGDAQGMCLSTI